MGSSIFSYGILERFRVGRALRPVTDKYGPEQERASREALHEGISAMESAVERKPTEWIYWYTLGDWYQTVGEIGKSIRACQRCCELRPKDIRSAYALATAYNLLTLAALTEEEGEKLSELKHVLGNVNGVDPVNARAELHQSEVAVDTATVQAIRWFERALALNPDGRSRAFVESHLRTLYKRFPHLQR